MIKEIQYCLPTARLTKSQKFNPPLNMKTVATLFCVLLIAALSAAGDPTPKPKIKVLADGFPAGHDTPEGVACDLARAFINRDVALFTNSCIPPFGGGVNFTNYQKFLQNTVQNIKDETKKKKPSPEGPKAITKVFAARQLSLGGPASYGYAVFNFREVMFVDIEAALQNGGKYVNRTLVIQTSDRKWYAHPDPLVDSLLSAGLNEESDSTTEFSAVYTVEK